MGPIPIENVVSPAKKGAPAALSVALSDVLHGSRGAAPSLGPLPQALERDAIDDAGHRLVDLPPELGQVGDGVPGHAPPPAPCRLEPVGRSLHRAEDVAHRDLVGGTRQAIAAGGAAPGDEEPGPREPP